jgi:DNA-binding transcriptional regulator YdaS (Cro superfamily)
MNLAEYIKSQPQNKARQFRMLIMKKFDISNSAIRHWCNGTRKISPKFVLQLEQLTKGNVTRHDLRPDLYPKE